jgi:polyisoprenoid-binding protein YceI
MKNKTLIRSAMFLLLVFGVSTGAYAETSYSFDCKDSKINTWIKYSVVGRYEAGFSECSGNVVFDQDKDLIKSVSLKIKLKSLSSNCSRCDGIVLSKRLMDAQTYPLIEFESKSIVKNKTDYEVFGVLHMHGVDGGLMSPFLLEELKDPKSGKEYMRIKGIWTINRKEYGITWNKLLDHGGIMVGDQVYVNWEVIINK